MSTNSDLEAKTSTSETENAEIKKESVELKVEPPASAEEKQNEEIKKDVTSENANNTEIQQKSDESKQISCESVKQETEESDESAKQNVAITEVSNELDKNSCKLEQDADDTNKENNTSESNATELEQKVVKQIEYYFGNVNLPRDKFLLQQIGEDDGWVSLEVMLKFNRLAQLTTSQKIIAEALEKSENKLVLVNQDKTKIRRNPDKPLPEKQLDYIRTLQAKTVYAKGFPKEEKLNDIMSFLEPYGKTESVIRRTSKDRVFKESCFIVFEDIDAALKFVKLENVKYKDIDILRKMQLDYYRDKKNQILERKKLHREKKETIVKQAAEKLEFPSGAILHFTDLPAENKLTREEIKEKVAEASTMNIAFIEFQKGDSAGYIRFANENNAKDFVGTLNTGEFEIGEIKFKVKALEGEEEKQYLQKTASDIAKLRQKSKGFKRKGDNFGRSKYSHFKKGKHM